MTPEVWQQVRMVLDELSRSEPAERTRRLTQLPAEVRSEVERLLLASDQIGDTTDDDGQDSGLSGHIGNLDAWLPAIIGEILTFDLGQVLLDRFEIRRFLGAGGMGEVYEAHDRKMGAVALKTIRFELLHDSTITERFRREVQRARLVTHSNVCRVHDLFDAPIAGEADAVPFASMELIRGETLHAAVKRRGPFPESEARQIALQLCSGLGEAHRSGVIHRDFKSGNVILDTGAFNESAAAAPRAVITDFGLARLLTASEESRTAAGGGPVGGTRAYLAPELILGHPASRRSDIFALGVVLYRMSRGLYPFDPDLEGEIAVEVRQRPLASVRDAAPDLSPEWERAVAACLAFDPEQRPASTAELAGLLEGRVLPVRGKVFWSRRYLLGGAGLLGLGGASVLAWRSLPAGPVLSEGAAAPILIEEFSSPAEGPALGRAARNLFRISLGASTTVKPLSPKTIQETLDGLGLSTMPLRGNTARAVAQSVRASLVMAGELRMHGASGQLTVRLRRSDDNRELASVTEVITDPWKLPAVIDRVCVRLGLLSGVVRAQVGNMPVEQADTTQASALEQFTLGLEHYSTVDRRTALAHFQEANRLDPDFAIAWVYQAIAHYSFREDDLAVEPAARAWKLRDRLTGRLRHQAGTLYYIVVGDHEQAAEESRLLVRMFPTEASLQRHYAQSLALVEKNAQAIEPSIRAWQLDPASLQNQSFYIAALAQRGDFNSAEQALADAFAAQPNHPMLRLTRVHLRMMGNRNAEAAAEAEALAAVDEFEVPGRNRQIRALLLAGRWEEARDVMLQVLPGLAVRTGNTQAETYHYWLGQIELALDRTAAAVSHAQSLATSPATPTRLDALRNAALLAWQTRVHAPLRQATASLATVADGFPSTRAQSFRLTAEGLLADLNGDVSLARQALASATSVFSDSQCAFLYAEYLRRHGRHAEAAPMFERVVAARTSAIQFDSTMLWVWALGLAGECWTLAGNPDMARTRFQLFLDHWGGRHEMPLVQSALRATGTQRQPVQSNHHTKENKT